MWEKPTGPRRWYKHNERVYDPTPIGETERPAFVCHVKKNIKYSPDKMWYVACLVRGLRIDEAISQLQFVHKKGASAAIETLQEAREMALKEHYVEYPSNLWVVHREKNPHRTGDGSFQLANITTNQSKGFNLNKKEFVDAVALRYGWPWKDSPTPVCVDPPTTSPHHDVQKGGFVCIGTTR
ncbi:39S ribosomal protein L22, mitochondrial [Chionoecetes opilio]|uniref:Large ribosomal subunit protein uL22m n=1 Tax=Chionoecetes opilio TaxID=41210 RepID=A0A8J4Y7H5_CHIOP|nr:39S ribosomal protein L22, mitochondrial [Chionoecetes opilio]